MLRISFSFLLVREAAFISSRRLSATSSRHSIKSGLNVPHSPFWIICRAVSCENAFLYTRSLVSAS